MKYLLPVLLAIALALPAEAGPVSFMKGLGGSVKHKAAVAWREVKEVLMLPVYVGKGAVNGAIEGAAWWYLQFAAEI